MVDEPGAPTGPHGTGVIAYRYWGRDVTAREMALLRSLITQHPTRAAIARAFCRETGWRKTDRGLKDMTARTALLAMHTNPSTDGPPPHRTSSRAPPPSDGPLSRSSSRTCIVPPRMAQSTWLTSGSTPPRQMSPALSCHVTIQSLVDPWETDAAVERRIVLISLTEHRNEQEAPRHRPVSVNARARCCYAICRRPPAATGFTAVAPTSYSWFLPGGEVDETR